MYAVTGTIEYRVLEEMLARGSDIRAELR